VYRQGRSKSNRFLVLYAFPRAGEETDGEENGPRLGLSVSKRVGGAVERTRVKRVLREAFWAEADRLPAGSDYVVVARPDVGELAERAGMPGVRETLAELVDSIGGMPDVREPESPSTETPAGADAQATGPDAAPGESRPDVREAPR
jgi:ribonuclease P protein component